MTIQEAAQEPKESERPPINEDFVDPRIAKNINLPGPREIEFWSKVPSFSTSEQKENDDAGE